MEAGGGRQEGRQEGEAGDRRGRQEGRQGAGGGDRRRQEGEANIRACKSMISLPCTENILPFQCPQNVPETWVHGSVIPIRKYRINYLYGHSLSVKKKSSEVFYFSECARFRSDGIAVSYFSYTKYTCLRRISAQGLIST